jgi:hypothetical protein
VFREEVGGRRRLRRKRRRLVVDVERERERERKKKCIKTRFLFPFQISRPEWEEEVYSWGGGDWKDFLLDIKKRTSSIKKNRVGVYRYISTSIEYRKRYIERERKVMFYFSNFFIQGKSGGSLCAE